MSLETAFAFIVAVLLILGAAYIFTWMNKSMVKRQEAYKAAADPRDFNYAPEQLRIFKTD